MKYIAYSIALFAALMTPSEIHAADKGNAVKEMPYDDEVKFAADIVKEANTYVDEGFNVTIYFTTPHGRSALGQAQNKIKFKNTGGLISMDGNQNTYRASAFESIWKAKILGR